MEKQYKTLKNGVLTVYNGFVRSVFKPLSALVGVSDPQTLTNKTIDGSKNTLLNIPENTVQLRLNEDGNFHVMENGLTQTQMETNGN